MNATITVREATSAERPEVAEVTRLSYAQYASHSDPAFWSRYEGSTRQALLEREDASRIIMLFNDKIGASVLYCPPANEVGGHVMVQNTFPEMRLLAVLPQYREQKAAGLLIDACEKRAQLEGFEAITLHTTVLMQRAKAMYERRGYTRYPQIDFEPVPGFVVWGYIKRFPAKGGISGS